jgi:atypical dual specificity phosphatase
MNWFADVEFVEKKSCIIRSSKTSKTGGLWIGNFHAAVDTQALQAAGINYVVTALEPSYSGTLKKLYGNVGIHQLIVDSSDNPKCDLYKYFEEVCQWIGDARKNGNVMVHCYGGVSRSSTLTIAYLMIAKKIGWRETLAFVKQKRPVVSPNIGFKEQ